MDFNYEAETNNLNFISKFFPEVDLKGSLKSTGRVQGEIKNPRVTFSTTASDFGYKYIEVKSINLKGDALVNLESPKLQLDGNLKEIKFQGRKIKRIDLQAKNEGKGVRGDLLIVQDARRNYEINLKLADLTSEEKNLEIEKIRLNFKDNVIENKDTINVKLLPNQLIVKSLNLYHKDNFILGNADVVFDGNMNASLELKKVSLNDISEILELKPSIEGITSGNISLQGTLEKPIINANIGAKDLGFKGFRSDKIVLNTSYLNKKLNLDLNIEGNGRDILFARGNVDIDLDFKKIGENLNQSYFDITMKSNGVD